MVHLPALIQDLALILGAAGVVTLLFRKIKQPVILGYIIAGFLVGPHFSFFPTITEISSIKIWADIGVVFLLFALGLEFSFKKLAHVGGSAAVTALIEVGAMVLIGFLTGKMFGWKNIDCLFLGGILSISSTTVIYRAFDELGVKGRGFVSLVFGVLIVEDLFAVLLMVLLSTVAIGQSFSGMEMVGAGLKLLFFLILWFSLGIFLLPTLLMRVRPLMKAETLLVVSVALCLIMVVVATHAGFSPALGAFVMGSILAETSEGEKIQHLIRPVKDLFAAVFFVSVGMLIDPQVLLEYALPVVVITVVLMTGKTLGTVAGSIIAGRSLKHSIQSGLSLAQIGEFSFIIATLGLTLKVTSDFLYPIAVGVSAITTFTTPYMIRSADRVYGIVAKRMPTAWQMSLAKYSAACRGLYARGDWAEIFRAYLSKIIVNSVLVAAVFLAVEKYLAPILTAHIDREKLASGAALITALFLSAPFLWALVLSRIKFPGLQRPLSAQKYRTVFLTLEASRWLFALLLFAILATRFIAFELAAEISLGLTVIFLVLFSRHLSSIYTWMESRFVKNLSAKSDGFADPNSMAPLAPWDAHLARLEMKPESPVIGGRLDELKIRENFGVTIALIERGNRKIAAPGRNERLFPHDRIAIIGTDEQIEKFRQLVEPGEHELNREIQDLKYALHPIAIDVSSPFLGRSIRDSGIRELSRGLVVGVERKGNRYLNPESLMIIEEGDLLWIVGDSEKIGRL
jgi:monovalent cation:H+ antiporter-2, CPA2 family